MVDVTGEWFAPAGRIFLKQGTKHAVKTGAISSTSTTGVVLTSTIAASEFVENPLKKAVLGLKLAGAVFSDSESDAPDGEGVGVDETGKLHGDVPEIDEIDDDDLDTMTDPTMIEQVADELATPEAVGTLAALEAAAPANADPIKVEVIVTQYPVQEEDRVTGR